MAFSLLICTIYCAPGGDPKLNEGTEASNGEGLNLASALNSTMKAAIIDFLDDLMIHEQVTNPNDNMAEITPGGGLTGTFTRAPRRVKNNTEVK